jgi:hypothetical protein
VFDGSGAARASLTGGAGSYAPAGDEGFVRVECRTGAQNAWSQVFWIVSGKEREP